MENRMRIKIGILTVVVMMIIGAKIYAFEPGESRTRILPPGNGSWDRISPILPQDYDKNLPPIIIEKYTVQLIDPETGEVIAEKTIEAIDVDGDGNPNSVIEYGKENENTEQEGGKKDEE